VEHARSVLSQVDLIRQKTARERRPAAGKIRLGCVSHVPRRLLTGVTRDFQRQYPDVEFVFFEGTPPELTRWLHNNVIDVGMMTVNEHFAVTIPFIQDELKVIVSTNHALATKSQVPLRAVLQELFIGPKTEHGIVNQMLSARNIPPFQSHQEVSAYNTIFAMVREGIGISLMPQTLIDMQYEDLVVLSIEPRMQLSVQLVNNNQLPTAMDFMDSAHRWAKIHGFLPDDM
ncbi:MAG: LysR family transcriptional regulator substrate-binding protein, partial [Chloroflexota bacterium]